MPGAADEAAAQLGQRLDHQVGRGRDAARVDHQRIQLALSQLVHLQLGRTAGDGHPHLGVARRHVAEQRRHQQRAGAGAQADADGARLALAQQLGAAFDLGRLEHDALRARQHRLAQRGERAAPAAAVDQARAQFVLQPLQAAAEGRLRQVHALGRARERAFLGQRHQVFQLPQVHRAMTLFH